MFSLLEIAGDKDRQQDNDHKGASVLYSNDDREKSANDEPQPNLFT